MKRGEDPGPGGMEGESLHSRRLGLKFGQHISSNDFSSLKVWFNISDENI